MHSDAGFYSSRRGFVAGALSAPVAASAAFAQPAARRMRIAQVGTGGRGTYWATSLIRNFADAVQIVGLCDINRKRVDIAKEMVGSSATTFVEFDRMIAETKPELVLVTTTDSAHCQYIIRAMELGCDVLTEKPLCTDEEQCRLILEAEKRYGRKLIVAFNARHYPQAKKVKQMLLEKAIGEVVSVDYQEYLDTSHGASYFRRWHRIKEASGTLLVSKSVHHFDQVNWWLDATPLEVTGAGDLRFYGRNHPFRHTHCRGCPYKDRCEFYTDITKNENVMKLYVAAESEDGYQYDGCVWRQDANIYDTYAVTVKFDNRARLCYTANTFMPYEGQEIAINGTKGRIDFNMYDGGGFSDHEVRLTRTFGKSEVIRDFETRTGGHGGADPSLHEMIFRTPNAPDPLALRAGSRAGALAALVGIAGYRSIERGGDRVRIKDLVAV